MSSQEVRSALHDRLHHDQPVSDGSVQRSSRRTKSLKDEQAVLKSLEAGSIEREHVTSVVASKVVDTLEVTELAESQARKQRPWQQFRNHRS